MAATPMQEGVARTRQAFNLPPMSSQEEKMLEKFDTSKQKDKLKQDIRSNNSNQQKMEAKQKQRATREAKYDETNHLVLYGQ